MGGGTYSPPDSRALNREGELVLLGRAGRMVKIGGRRLELAEVEGGIRGLPEVREVVAFQNPEKADSVAVVVAVDHVESTSGVNLRRLLTTRMAAWKVPDRWVVVSELPYTIRGKLDLRRMREWVQRDDYEGTNQ